MQSSIARSGNAGGTLHARSWRPLMALAAGCCLVALKPGPAQAADADESTAAGPASLQEIVVTANRREESASKVPISVSAYTQATMDSLGIKDFTDIARFTPGVQIDSGQTNAISIRGISSSGGAGTTGIYIDDTPIQIRALGFNPDDTLPKTFDLDRVEVLRGPQGTLFGSGSEGGTVRYIMTQPSLTKTSTYARAEVSYTQGGEPSYEAGAAFGTPLIDGTLGVRVSAWFRKDGGWIDRMSDTDPSQVVDKKANRDETQVFRAALVWAPTSGVTVTPSFLYQYRERHDTSYYWQYGSEYSNPSTNYFVSANPTGQIDPDKYYLSSIKVQADLGFAQLISNSAYYERHDVSGYDGTLYNLSYYQTLGWAGGETSVPGYNIPGLLPAAGSGLVATTTLPCSPQGYTCYPLLDGSGVHLPQGPGVPATVSNYTSPATVTNNQYNYSQEIRLQSNDGNAPVVWTAGAFWSFNKTFSLEEIHDPNVDALFNFLYGAPINALYGTATNPDGSTYLPYGDSYLNRIIGYDRQLAGFGEVVLRGDLVGLPQGLKLTLGGRYSKMDYSFNSYNDGPQNGGPGGGNGTDHEHPVTYRGSLAYQINPSDMVYATYSTGFRIGGANSNIPYQLCYTDFNNFGISGNPSSFKSDTVKNTEIGAKMAVANRLRVAASAYYITWNNIQQTVFLPVCALQYVDNVGAAVSKGADLQLDFAVTDSFTLQSAVGYNSSYYTSAAFPGHTAPTDPTLLPLVAKGDAIVGESGTANAPWTITLGAEYRFHLLEHETYIRVDAERQSQNHRLTAAEDPNSAQYAECSTDGGGVQPCNFTPSATTFVSMRAGQEIGPWNISLFADNLFNTHTITNYNYQGTDGFGPQIQGPYSTAAVATPQYRYMTFRPRTIGITAAFRY
jgi:outer membrane receptor protein involved in Fe transport